MKTGAFINYILAYKKDDIYISAKNQALNILEKARTLINDKAIGVAITYSANYGQTLQINKVYNEGGWNTETSGANQAEVMSNMELLLETTYKSLKTKIRIAPITTMNAYTNPLDPWRLFVSFRPVENIVNEDLKRIKNLLEHGWTVLGWQNQDTAINIEAPYAIGGGIAKLPFSVNKKIQETLKGCLLYTSDAADE